MDSAATCYCIFILPIRRPLAEHLPAQSRAPRLCCPSLYSRAIVTWKWISHNIGAQHRTQPEQERVCRAKAGVDDDAHPRRQARVEDKIFSPSSALKRSNRFLLVVRDGKNRCKLRNLQ